MTALLTWLIFAVLMTTALIHSYWAFGGLWPGDDESSLAKSVVGTNGIENMPPRWVTGSVSIGIFAAALWPKLWLGWIDTSLPSWLLNLGMLALTLIFLARGLGGFSPIAKRMNSEEPFSTLDARYFSPLITALGLAMTYLLISNPWP